jgi:hypothetical protein
MEMINISPVASSRLGLAAEANHQSDYDRAYSRCPSHAAKIYAYDELL